MASRILIWHLPTHKSDGTRIGPAYYLETDYTPVAVRIHAGVTPNRADAEFDIFADGVSIFTNRSVNLVNQTTGVVTAVAPKTTVVLIKGDAIEEDAEDFNTGILNEGTWVTCNIMEAGNGENFTVQMELESIG